MMVGRFCNVALALALPAIRSMVITLDHLRIKGLLLERIYAQQ